MKAGNRAMATVLTGFTFLVIHSEATVRYVAKYQYGRPPVYPYTSWLTASTNIQNAVEAAEDGDTILIADGTYRPASEILVNKNINFRSIAGPLLTIIDGGKAHRCMRLVGSTNFVSGITFRNGLEQSEPGGGIYCDGGALVASNCTFVGNVGDGGGGGIYNGDAYGCEFKNNFAGNYGGGLCHGKAVNCTFLENSAQGDAGAIYDGLVVGCTIVSNTANSYGGGLMNCDAFDSAMLHNTSGREGGGMYGGTASNCTIRGNSTKYFGGGVANATVIDSTIWGNQTTEWYVINGGGGVYNGVLTNCYVIENWCVWEGYGAGMHSGSAVNCTIYANQGSHGAGGYNTTNINCLVTHNRSDIWGRISGIKDGVVYNCTITHNELDVGAAFSGVAYNSIIAGNSACCNQEDEPENSISPHLFNSCCPDVEHGVQGNITNAPLFDADYRLMATSPCIDTGLNNIAPDYPDLAFNPRITDGDFDGQAVVDMGAYEFQVRSVSIKVWPRAINLRNKARIWVALYPGPDLKTAEVDLSSIRFAGAAPEYTYNRMGILVFSFRSSDLNLTPASTQAMLLGRTYEGQLLSGISPIKIVPVKNDGGKSNVVF